MASLSNASIFSVSVFLLSLEELAAFLTVFFDLPFLLWAEAPGKA